MNYDEFKQEWVNRKITDPLHELIEDKVRFL